MTAVEQRLRDALFDEADALDESDDLFARVTLSIEDDRTLRRQRRRRIASDRLPGRRALAAVVIATTERTKGELVMDWWVLEMVWFAGMVFLALWLGPFIRRFGKSYAADVFRANPRTGKSFIVLMDVAYYLIFFAFILFTVQFEPDARLGPDGQRRPAPGVHGAARWHPADRRHAARAQRADAADHRPDPHAEPPPRRGHPAARATHQPGLIGSHAPLGVDRVCVRGAGPLDPRAGRQSGLLPTTRRATRSGAAGRDRSHDRLARRRRLPSRWR